MKPTKTPAINPATSNVIMTIKITSLPEMGASCVLFCSLCSAGDHKVVNILPAIITAMSKYTTFQGR